MIRRLVLVVALALLPLFSAPAKAIGEKVLVEIHALPFEIDPILPVTPERIAQQEPHMRFPLSNRDLREALRMLDYTGDGVFEEHFVRARFALPTGEVILVDRHGAFRRSKGDSFLRHVGKLQDALARMITWANTQRVLQWRFGSAMEATLDYVAKTTGWPESDFAITLQVDDSADPNLVVAKVTHIDIWKGGLHNPPILMAGGGLTEIHFDAKTRALMGTVVSQ